MVACEKWGLVSLHPDDVSPTDSALPIGVADREKYFTCESKSVDVTHSDICALRRSFVVPHIKIQ
jgi:hypothetical protein